MSRVIDIRPLPNYVVEIADQYWFSIDGQRFHQNAGYIAYLLWANYSITRRLDGHRDGEMLYILKSELSRQNGKFKFH